MARVVRSGLREDGTPSSVMLGCAIGDIIPHMGTTAPPGTLVCDGAEVSREVYAELYQEIGALVGQGDGSTTFNLPDLRGKWLMGADTEHAAGAEIAEGVPDISGYFYNIILGASHGVVYHNEGAFSQEQRADAETGAAQPTAGSAIFVNSFFASRSNAIYGAQDHVTPASVAVLPCIVYE